MSAPGMRWGPDSPAPPMPALAYPPRFRLDLSRVQVWSPGIELVGVDALQEVLFGPGGEPVALTLHVPEEMLLSWDWLEPFLSAPVVEAAPGAPPSGYVRVPRATHVHFDVEDDVLSAVCFDGSAPPSGAQRARAAPELELLFGGAAYRGWMLHRASHHLAHGAVPAGPSTPEADLPRLLAELLQQTNRTHLPAILRKDPAQEERLRALLRRLGVKGPVSAQRLALRAAVDGVLARYFRS